MFKKLYNTENKCIKLQDSIRKKFMQKTYIILFLAQTSENVELIKPNN